MNIVNKLYKNEILLYNYFRIKIIKIIKTDINFKIKLFIKCLKPETDLNMIENLMSEIGRVTAQ